MKLETNLNYRQLYQSVVLSASFVSVMVAGAYLTYLLLSMLFASPLVFFSLFGLAIGLGVALTYESETFQEETSPQITIKSITEVPDDE